jgi:hypothetical protein
LDTQKLRCIHYCLDYAGIQFFILDYQVMLTEAILVFRIEIFNVDVTEDVICARDGNPYRFLLR